MSIKNIFKIQELPKKGCLVSFTTDEGLRRMVQSQPRRLKKAATRPIFKRKRS
jgi:hypothetical protein